jgi:hypothetical protein
VEFVLFHGLLLFASTRIASCRFLPTKPGSQRLVLEAGEPARAEPAFKIGAELVLCYDPKKYRITGAVNSHAVVSAGSITTLPLWRRVCIRIWR